MLPGRAPRRIVHSHTHSMRLATGEEALVVRVHVDGGATGLGFSFDLDAGAARTMALWDATARAAGRPLTELLREAGPEVIDSLRVVAAGALAEHPWRRAWNAILDAARHGRGAAAAIDWRSEPAFERLAWIDPQPPGLPDAPRGW